MPKGKAKGHPSHRETSSAKKKERAVRQALKRERKAGSYLSPGDPDFKSFSNQLATQGLRLHDVAGDGNCLFRALADQLRDGRVNHASIRRDVVQYMRDNEDQFAPFVEGDITFQKYVRELAKDGEYAGNDAIVAFSRCYSVHVCIHQLNAPRWEVYSSEDKPAVVTLHVAYLNQEHYCSVRSLIAGHPLPQVHPPLTTPSKGAQFTPPPPSPTPLLLPPPPTPLPGNASLGQLEGVTSTLVERVAQLSQCQDLELVENALMENGFEEDRALAEVLQLLSLSDTAGLQQCPCVNPSGEVKCKPVAVQLEEEDKPARKHPKHPPLPAQRHLSNRERKEEVKAARKERRVDERRTQKSKKEAAFDPVGAMAI